MTEQSLRRPHRCPAPAEQDASPLVPEFTATACSACIYSARDLSNSTSTGPRLRREPQSTFTTASISDSVMSGAERGIDSSKLMAQDPARALSAARHPASRRQHVHDCASDAVPRHTDLSYLLSDTRNSSLRARAIALRMESASGAASSTLRARSRPCCRMPTFTVGKAERGRLHNSAAGIANQHLHLSQQTPVGQSVHIREDASASALLRRNSLRLSRSGSDCPHRSSG